MSLSHNPRVVTSGLVAHYDAANSASAVNFNRNLIAQPENISSFGIVAITSALSTISAPNGSKTVYAITEGASSAQHLLYYSFGTVAINDVYTFSGYFKNNTNTTQITLHTNGEGTATFNISGVSAGTVAGNGGAGTLSSSISPAGDGWYRCSVTFKKANTVGTFYVSNQNGLGIYTGDTSISYYEWGLQLEYGAVLSEYYSSTTTGRIPLWKDLSGNSNNATVVGTPTFNSVTNALRFTGLQYLTIPNPLDQTTLRQEWTVSAWVNIDTTVNQILLTLDNWLYVSYADTRTLLYLNGGVNDYYTYGAIVAGTGWCYVTYRFRNSDGYRTIYKNGVNISQGGPNNTSTPIGNAATLTIGSNLRGSLSKLEIYNRVLTDSEVLQNFNATRGRYGI